LLPYEQHFPANFDLQQPIQTKDIGLPVGIQSFCQFLNRGTQATLYLIYWVLIRAVDLTLQRVQLEKLDEAF